MNFILNAFALQDIGTRDNQEDCFFPPFIDPCHFDETSRDWSYYDGTPHTGDRMFLVCDGMGGHDRGEVASRIVTKVMSESLLKSAPSEGVFTDEMLQDAVDEALDALAAEDDPNEIRKMGTTMTVLKFHADGATVGHVGDSRVYHFRPAHDSQPATIMFRTEDHTMVNDMVHQGQLTIEQALKSPKKHVLSRSMTSEKDYRPELEIDHITDINAGDIFLLCSDGIYEKMGDADLCKLACDPNYSDAERAQQLLRECNDNQDNHTAILVRVIDVLNGNTDKMSPDTLPVGTVLRSKNYTYHIEKTLGQGAFGVTYLVNTSISMQGQLGTIHTDVKVALKEFFMHNDMERKGSELIVKSNKETVDLFREKFYREAMKLAMLSHPNIVKVLEVFEANNTIYYSMEYLPGGSLKEYVDKKDGLPESEAIAYIRQISSALMYMHRNKMLHLDVKPANVMRDANCNTLKLIDFGLAKQYDESGEAQSTFNLGCGTPGYAPLEQSDETNKIGFSPQLDVYALGATYYKLLTAEVPNSAISVLNRGLYTMPLVKKNVSQKSINAIKAAMEPTTAKRLRTVREFLDMLPSVDDKAVLRKKNRRRLGLWISAAVILALVVMGCVKLMSYYEMQKVYGDDEESIVDPNINIPMVEVEGGEFYMGSNDKEAEGDEKPVHKVVLHSFRMSKYEVTLKLWKAVMENRKPTKSRNGDFPVYNVTWNAVQIFIKRLNERSGHHFRLPTEAEWEYAARGGNKATKYKYSGADVLDSVAWYANNSGGYIHPVGTLKPNSLGVYDMCGNVWEYCSDLYGDYIPGEQNNPEGTRDGEYHVIRGGSWENKSHSCRVTYRMDNSKQVEDQDIGIRLVEDI